jgi:hypothetical protein
VFLGLVGYYKKFILGYAKIVGPLFELTKKDHKFSWTLICQVAFVIFKKKLVETLILEIPNFNQSFILDVSSLSKEWVLFCHRNLENKNRLLHMAQRISTNI